eukprot:2654629-Amphidinium_carterae.1
MEENQCYAIVKPPPHKSWIMSLHSEHGARMIKIGKHYYIHSVVMDGFINNVQMSRNLLSHKEDSDMQHAEDVPNPFNLLDPENQSIATHCACTSGDFSCRERELYNLTHIPFRSWCE